MMERDIDTLEKIVRMDQRSGLGRRVAAELRAYWEGLRRGRALPARSDVDPRGIERALEYAFILERVAPGMGRFRLAGMHLNDLMGMEVRGMPLTAFFAPPARKRIAEATEAVFQGPSVAELVLSAESGIGKPPLTARLILLPLRSDLGDVTRVLGCLVAEGENIGRTPRRFEVEGADIQQVVTGMPTPSELPKPVSPEVLGFAEEAAPRFGVPPRKAPEAPRATIPAGLATRSPEERRAMFRVVKSEE